MNPDLEDIALACQHHDPAAQQQLYELFAPMMLGVCCRYTRNRDEAQDLLHDGFIKVFEKIGHLQNLHAVEDWIYHIMVNTAVNHVQRRHIVLESFDDAADEMFAVDDSGLSAEELADCIRQLSDPYRVVFNLREVEGEDFATIASRLGIAETSARSILSRAKRMLRDKINNI